MEEKTVVDEKDAVTSTEATTDEAVKETVASTEATTDDAVVEETVTSKTCSQCGAELTEEQIFCPHCGQKNDVQVDGENSEAIEQFNQGVVEQAKKKKKKIKVLIILLIIIGVIAVGVVGVYAFFNGQVEDIIDGINSKNPSSTTIEADYEALTPVGQFLFRGKIVDAFVDMVSDNVYTNSSNDLVNESALDKYATYKKIGQTLSITDDDGTNVMSHINTVLRLQAYEQYNDVSNCALNSASDCSDFLEYFNDARNASSYYVIKLYIGYAHTSAQSALSSARIYSSGDTLCTKYINALETIEEELSDLYYTPGYFSSSSFASALSTIGDMVADISDAEKSVKSIVDSIPKIN